MKVSKESLILPHAFSSVLSSYGRKYFNKTRKNVLDAQSELKKKPLNEIKKYLRQQGLLKAGSVAPQDVVRKMYENAVMAGGVTNLDQTTLLHNFLHQE